MCKLMIIARRAFQTQLAEIKERRLSFVLSSVIFSDLFGIQQYCTCWLLLGLAFLAPQNDFDPFLEKLYFFKYTIKLKSCNQKLLQRIILIVTAAPTFGTLFSRVTQNHSTNQLQQGRIQLCIDEFKYTVCKTIFPL